MSRPEGPLPLPMDRTRVCGLDRRGRGLACRTPGALDKRWDSKTKSSEVRAHWGDGSPKRPSASHQAAGDKVSWGHH